MLNVSLLRKNQDGTTTPVDGDVTASAYNLNGQMKDLQMRRVTEGASFYFIGEVAHQRSGDSRVRHRRRPSGQQSKYSVQFKREFSRTDGCDPKKKVFGA